MAAWHDMELAALTSVALAGGDTTSVLNYAVERVAAELSIEHCAVWEHNPNTGLLALRAGLGWPQTALQHASIDVSATAHLAHTLHAILPTVAPGWPRAAQQTLPQLGIDLASFSACCAVIQSHDRPWGILEADYSADRGLVDHKVWFLHAVANLLALAIKLNEKRPSASHSEHVASTTIGTSKQAVYQERQRLARELHDSVTQSLYSVTLHAEAAMRLLTVGDVGGTRDNLQVLQATAQEALDELRLLIFELRPPVLEQLGLAAALQARLNAVEGRANLRTRLLVDGVGRLPLVTEEALYRIAQEALNNALKHAHAHRITVRLFHAAARLVLEISDDGVGFDPAAAAATGGFGLQSIGERVTRLAGTLDVHSQSGAGTQLRVEIPL